MVFHRTGLQGAHLSSEFRLIFWRKVLHQCEAIGRERLVCFSNGDFVHDLTDLGAPPSGAAAIHRTIRRVQNDLEHAARPDANVLPADAQGKQRAAKERHRSEARDEDACSACWLESHRRRNSTRKT